MAKPRTLANTVADGGPLAGGGVSLSQVSGTLSPANGGTGQTTFTNGQLLIGNAGSLAKATLTAGTGINITNGPGSITIAASSGGATSAFSYFCGNFN